MVEWWTWILFLVGLAALFALDLGVLHRGSHEVRFREALLWSGVWVAVGLAFSLVVLAWRGGTLAAEYLAGYVIEWSLSVDNIFVFVLVLASFGIPAAQRGRLLMWGVVGAVVLRLGFILAGAALLDAFSWVPYVFGAILLVTAVRFLRERENRGSFEHSPVLRAVRRFVPLTDEFEGDRFVVRRGGRRVATPLVAALALITASDVIFAVDSIPAVFAVTRDAFVAFSSNALAVLGLRPLFFVLAGAVDRFHYLKHALAAILAFVGLKLILHAQVEIPTWLSLGLIVLALGIGVAASLLHARRHPPAELAEAGES